MSWASNNIDYIALSKALDESGCIVRVLLSTPLYGYVEIRLAIGEPEEYFLITVPVNQLTEGTYPLQKKKPKKWQRKKIA